MLKESWFIVKKLLGILVLSLLWCNISFAERFKINLECTLFIKGEYFATKTFILDSNESGGYLDYVNDSIVEFHESIPTEEKNAWLLIFYHVDRFSGKGNLTIIEEITDAQIIKFSDKIKNKKGLDRRSLRNSLNAETLETGDVECKAAPEKAF